MQDRDPKAVAVVDEAVAAHGGIERWEASDALELNLTVGGLVFWARGSGGRVGEPFDATVDLSTGAVRFHPFANRTEWIGHYSREELKITNHETGAVVEKCETQSRPRGFFKSLVVPWSTLDHLFFAGYAISEYYRLPFLLLDERISLRRLSDARGDRRVRVKYPPEMFTHSPTETLHFAPSGLLVRHDYAANFFMRGGTGSHFSEDYSHDSGLAVAKRRRVRLRAIRWALPVTILKLDIHDARLAS